MGPNSLEVIQAEKGYVIRVVAPNPARAQDLMLPVEYMREAMEKMDLAAAAPSTYENMQRGIELLQAAGEALRKGQIPEERYITVPNGRALLETLEAIIAVWEPPRVEEEEGEHGQG